MEILLSLIKKLLNPRVRSERLKLFSMRRVRSFKLGHQLESCDKTNEFLVRKLDNNCIYIYLPPSKDSMDWVYNVLSFPVIKLIGKFPMLFHLGFFIAASKIKLAVKSRLDELDASNASIIYIEGYSHGAAVAQILISYLKLWYKKPIIEGYLFGSPKPVHIFNGTLVIISILLLIAFGLNPWVISLTAILSLPYGIFGWIKSRRNCKHLIRVTSGFDLVNSLPPAIMGAFHVTKELVIQPIRYKESNLTNIPSSYWDFYPLNRCILNHLSYDRLDTKNDIELINLLK